MLNEEVLDRLSNKLTNRVIALNNFMVKKLSEQIVTIGKLTPSQLRELYQSVEYGANINEIIEKISEFTKLSERDIINILTESAKINQEYARRFYKYRDMEFIPYDKNEKLQLLVKSIAKRTIEQFENIARTGSFAFINASGEIEYTEIGRIYQRITDEAILNIMTGRESYTETMKKTMKVLAGQGIQEVDYASGYHRRLDSSVRLNVMEGVRTLEDNLQIQFGEEFGADGVEVVHHIHPAPDHSSNDDIGWYDIDGQQFSLKEAKTVNGKRYESFEFVNNSLNRPVGTLNCYHTQIPIILGVSEPIYSKKELDRDKERNANGFELDGKHYTLYEGTQLQRRLETKIREYKSIQESMRVIEANSDNIIETIRYKDKIKYTTNKYKELCDKSGLPTRVERLKNIK